MPFTHEIAAIKYSTEIKNTTADYYFLHSLLLLCLGKLNFMVMDKECIFH